MTIEAGRLRHRIDIQRRAEYQDSNGDMIPTWQDVFRNVPASIEPLSAREFIAAQANQSQVTARIMIRYRDGLDASMRIVHKRIGRPDTIYNIHGVLADLDSGLDYLTLPVSTGVNDG